MLLRKLLLLLFRRREDASAAAPPPPAELRIACVHAHDIAVTLVESLSQVVTMVEAGDVVRYGCEATHAVLGEVVANDLARFNVSVSDTGC